MTNDEAIDGLRMTPRPFERKSDVDGFTIIFRRHRSPKVHLLRSWDECNVELARKRDVRVMSVPGSRENLHEALDGRRPTWCRRCFPTPEKEPEITPELAYADPVEVA